MQLCGVLRVPLLYTKEVNVLESIFSWQLLGIARLLTDVWEPVWLQPDFSCLDVIRKKWTWNFFLLLFGKKEQIHLSVFILLHFLPRISTVFPHQRIFVEYVLDFVVKFSTVNYFFLLEALPVSLIILLWLLFVMSVLCECFPFITITYQNFLGFWPRVLLRLSFLGDLQHHIFS